MAGDTGQGQVATIFAQSIPNIRSIQVQNTGNIISETVADGVLTAVIGTGWQFVIDFVAPTTGTHTLEGAIDAGTTGAITIDSGQTRYTSSAGRSGGFTKSSPSNGFITYSLTVAIDGDPTMAAVP
jgi:hypothetical protein